MSNTWSIRAAKGQAKRMLVRIRRTVPPGLRLVLGLLLMVGGVFAFLPVLGLWMIPLGLAVAALDVKLFQDWIRGRTQRRGTRGR